MPAAPVTPSTATTDAHRGRLLDGMAEAITEKGYAATTIADVVRHARVSKRTFYEHFADKEAALLATYSAVSDAVLAVIAEAVAVDAPGRERIDTGVRAYLATLSAQPALTRTFLVEIQAAGPNAQALRRDVMQRFADGLRATFDEVRRHEPGLPPLTDGLATALVGGVNELLLRAIGEGRADALEELSDVASEFLAAVLLGERRPG